VLLGDVRGRAVRAGHLPAGGDGVRFGGGLLLVRVRDRSRRDGRPRVRQPGRLLVAGADVRERGRLLLAGLRRRRLRQRDVCADRKPVHDGARLLRRRVHGRHVRAEPRLPPRRGAVRDGGRVLRAQLRRARRRWRDHVRVAAGVSR
jgi:hypothetical protein